MGAERRKGCEAWGGKEAEIASRGGGRLLRLEGPAVNCGGFSDGWRGAAEGRGAG